MLTDCGKYLCLSFGIKELMNSFISSIDIYYKSKKYHLKYKS